MNKTALAAFVTALSLFGSVAFQAKAFANPPAPINHTYAWTIEIDTQELPRQFQYRGSTINQCVKAQLQYYSMSNQNAKTTYEDLWYSNARSLGLERHNTLGITPGDAIAITVVHLSNTAVPIDEQQAAGKAVMKAIVDANLNKNMVATIRVPSASFMTISSVIQSYNFTPITLSGDVEAPVSSDINLFLESVPPGLSQTFVHYH